MTLTEAIKLLPKMQKSPRGKVDLIKRARPDDPESYIIFFRLESGSHAQVANETDWPLPKTLV